MRKGQYNSQETKNKISLANKGRFQPNRIKNLAEYVKTHEPGNKGHKGYKISKEYTKKRLGRIPWNKGIKGVMKANSGSFKKGHQPTNLAQLKLINTGRPKSEETRRKLSASKKGKPLGERSGNWKGGISIGDRKKEYNRFKCLERLSRNRNASGSHSIEEWERLKAQYDWTCLHCGKKEPEIKLTEDHIIPLIKGGSNNIENIQPLCKPCNSRKGSKII